MITVLPVRRYVMVDVHIPTSTCFKYKPISDQSLALGVGLMQDPIRLRFIQNIPPNEVQRRNRVLYGRVPN